MNFLMQSLKKEKNFLIFLFLFSFLIRALFFVLFLSKDKKHLLCDSQTYHEIGVQVAAGKGITFSDGNLDFFRVPGYPVFLGINYKIFGVDPIKALWMQILLASFLSLFIFCLSLVLFPSKLLLAKISALYSCVHLGYVLFSGLLMTEILFAFFFAIALIAFLYKFDFFFCSKALRLPSYLKFFFSGVFLGIASLIRPVGHYYLVLFIAMLMLSNCSFGIKTKQALLLFISWFAIVFPWLLRNYLLTGFIFFHTWTGVHFMHYFASPLYMKEHGGTFQQASRQICLHEFRDLLDSETKKAGHKLSEIEVCLLGEGLAFKYIKNDPAEAIKLAFYNIFKTCFALYSSDLLVIAGDYAPACYDKGVTFWSMMKRFLFPRVNNFAIKTLVWYEIFCWFFILFGFLLAFLIPFSDQSFFCALLKVLPITGLMIFLTFVSGVARLRMPIEPFIIIFSFYFWLFLFSKLGLKVQGNE